MNYENFYVDVLILWGVIVFAGTLWLLQYMAGKNE